VTLGGITPCIGVVSGGEVVITLPEVSSHSLQSAAVLKINTHTHKILRRYNPFFFIKYLSCNMYKRF